MTVTARPSHVVETAVAIPDTVGLSTPARVALYYLVEWHGRASSSASTNMHFRANSLTKFAHHDGVKLPGTSVQWWADRKRLLALAVILEDHAAGWPLASHPDVTLVLEEGRAHIADCGYSGDVAALSDRSVARILKRHVEDGISGFVALCDLPEWKAPCIETCPACHA